MNGRPGIPIGRRILVATLIVAVVAVVVTAVAALGFLRSVNTTAARNAMDQQAEQLAAAAPAERATLIASLSAGGGLVALVPAKGTLSGAAAALVPPRAVIELRAGRGVSTSTVSDGRSYLLEGRPSADGGGVIVMQDAATVRSLTPSLAWRIAVALLIGIAVAVLAAILAARRLGRPLATLAARARRLGAGERGLGPPPPSGVEEIDEIDAALHALDSALVHSEGRQREFLLSVSHEIRTPLTALRGYAEAMADGVIGPEELGEVGRTIRGETARLTRFTDDLLALARLEADDFRLDLADVDPRRVALEAADGWRATAAGEGVTIATSATDPVPTIRTDPHRLRQLVDGLIENALRVSPAGTTIAVAVRAVGDGVEVEVADQGPGLTAEDAAQAFERGRLRDRYAGERKVGSGLGLSIAARLVARLGGTIEASPGVAGAVFRIRLPGS